MPPRRPENVLSKIFLKPRTLEDIDRKIWESAGGARGLGTLAGIPPNLKPLRPAGVSKTLVFDTAKMSSVRPLSSRGQMSSRKGFSAHPFFGPKPPPKPRPSPSKPAH